MWPRRAASSWAPNHKVLCHSRSPFITIVTVRGLVGDGDGTDESPDGRGVGSGELVAVGAVGGTGLLLEESGALPDGGGMAPQPPTINDKPVARTASTVDPSAWR